MTTETTSKKTRRVRDIRIARRAMRALSIACDLIEKAGFCRAGVRTDKAGRTVKNKAGEDAFFNPLRNLHRALTAKIGACAARKEVKSVTATIAKLAAQSPEKLAQLMAMLAEASK